MDLDFVFKSPDHLRYENGNHVSGPHGGAGRAIKVEPNIDGCEGYKLKSGVGFIVTVYNLDGDHPVWQNNVQMTPKPMKIVSQTDDKVVLRGFHVQAQSPFGWVDFNGEDYGLTIKLNNGEVESCILHMHDRNVDIEYLKNENQQSTEESNPFNVEERNHKNKTRLEKEYQEKLKDLEEKKTEFERLKKRFPNKTKNSYLNRRTLFISLLTLASLIFLGLFVSNMFDANEPIKINENEPVKTSKNIQAKKKSDTIIIYELDDLIKLDVDELRIKRNEVYARRGRMFKSKYLQEYFSKTDWYEPRFENVENLLSKQDRDNISKVKRVENIVKFQNIEEAKLKFKLPNIHWRFTERKTHKDKIIYTYKRDVILDSAGRKIDPQISFIIEPVGSNTDVIQYSIAKKMATPFELIDMFTHEDGSMKFKNGVGYQGKYFDSGLEHRIYIVHGINNKMGFTLVMDTTEEVSDIVAPEFQKCLSTLDIKK